ncbi:MAG: HlyC/CorC family transporter [Ruminococcus sp.]|nr:HlyC/CorC family transporter [Ruminococcus sp.]
MDAALIALLLVLSALCSATETAFSSCNRIRLKKMAEEGSRSAGKALKICEDFDKALTAILIGNNVVNILSSALATVFFTERFGSGSVGIATAVMTVLVLIFGEILPKSLAKENSERFSVFMAAPLSAFMFIITPLIWIFSGIKKLVMKMVGSGKDAPSVTEEELKYIIDEIEDEGVLEEQESDLVRSALEFDEIAIEKILVPRVRVAAAEAGESIEEIKDLFLKTRYSRLPVYEKDLDHIIGVIHQSDFFEMYVSKKKKDIRRIINEPIYLTENRKISEALRIMQKEKVHMAVVVDQYGGTAGICTLEDIIEELVGEIYDESDEEDTSFVRLGENECDISAELSVSDFLERFDMDGSAIETERLSMGGWVMELLDRIPEEGERVFSPPFEMEIKMRDEQKIDRIRIKLTEEREMEDK